MDKLYIICIDDLRDVLLSVARDLRVFSDWTILEECESADEAIEVLDELEIAGKPLALLVCDHIMPGTLGVDFLTKVEESHHFKYVKKILMTGQATHADTINAINFAKIDSYIEKPWNTDQLRDVCRRLLTEYIFDAGLDIMDYRKYADSKVMLQRMQEGQ